MSETDRIFSEIARKRSRQQRQAKQAGNDVVIRRDGTITAVDTGSQTCDVTVDGSSMPGTLYAFGLDLGDGDSVFVDFVRHDPFVIAIKRKAP
jgi:hypothetical protein